jgi:hypothetical protein
VAQLTLTFDLGSQTVTGASIDGRQMGVGGVIAVALMKGKAEILNQDGGNLLAEFQGPAVDHTARQLSIAKAFGFQDEKDGGEGTQS